MLCCTLTPCLEMLVSIPRSSIDDQLKCPVCLSVFEKTLTTREVPLFGVNNADRAIRAKQLVLFVVGYLFELSVFDVTYFNSIEHEWSNSTQEM